MWQPTTAVLFKNKNWEGDTLLGRENISLNECPIKDKNKHTESNQG